MRRACRDLDALTHWSTRAARQELGCSRVLAGGTLAVVRRAPNVPPRAKLGGWRPARADWHGSHSGVQFAPSSSRELDARASTRMRWLPTERGSVVMMS